MAISRVVEDDEGMITRSDPDGYRGISYVIDTNMQTELVNLLQGGNDLPIQSNTLNVELECTRI